MSEGNMVEKSSPGKGTGISRRDFLKLGVAALAGLGLSSCGSGGKEEEGPSVSQDSPSSPVAQHESESREEAKGPIFLEDPRRYSQEEISVERNSMYQNFVVGLGDKMITYSDKVFERTTLLFFTNPKENNKKPVVAEILPVEFKLKPQPGQKIILVQYAWSGLNEPKNIDITQLKNPTVMPIATTGNSTQGIVPIRDENGKIVGGTYTPSGVAQSPGGLQNIYWGWALFEEGENPSEKCFLGIIIVSQPGIYIDDTKDIPKEVEWALDQ